MPIGWEYYQQQLAGGGVSYPLYWLCGLAGTTVYSQQSPLGVLNPPSANTLYAVPFDQNRAVTIDGLSLILNAFAAMGALCRLGIYQNARNANNVPGALILDSGPITIDNTAALGVVGNVGLNTNLAADTRYWAVLQCLCENPILTSFGPYNGL